MGFFTRAKTADPTPAEPVDPARKKIMLNFRAGGEAAGREIAAGTLKAGGFDAGRDGLPPIGTIMPDGTIYAGMSPGTGKPMYTTPGDAPLTMKWQEAMDYAAKLDAHGYKDWRLPTKGELNVLFNNRAAIGGFNVSGSNPAGWYWSGTQYGTWNARVQRFSVGCQGYYSMVYRSSVRCVR